MHATVTERNGRLLADLPRSAFQIYENDKPALVQDFTHDIRQLETSLKQIDSTGATAMRDETARGERQEGPAGGDRWRGQQQPRRVGSCGAGCPAKRILIYAIGLPTSETAKSAAVAKRDLDALTLATGGEVRTL